MEDWSNLQVKYVLTALITFNLVVQQRNCPQEAWPNLSGAGPASQGSGSQVCQGGVVYQPKRSKLPIINTGGRTWRGQAVEVCDAAEKQARTLQPAGQPVGHLQAGRVQARGGLGENSSALEDMMIQAKKQIISIICQKFKKCDTAKSKCVLLTITSHEINQSDRGAGNIGGQP